MHTCEYCKAGQAVRKIESDSKVMFSTRLQLSEPVPDKNVLHAACQVGNALAEQLHACLFSVQVEWH